MEITQLTEASEEALRDINALLSQLRKDDPNPSGSMEDLQAIVNTENHIMLVVKDGSKIIGMATLYLMQKMSKLSAHVEDVVVDSTYRGQGLGEKLMREVIQIARAKNVSALFLTSRPARTAARALYQKVGFEIKDTSVFRMKL